MARRDARYVAVGRGRHRSVGRVAKSYAVDLALIGGRYARRLVSTDGPPATPDIGVASPVSIFRLL
ncbi:hypothetical protein F01_420234 [Burkholderia cenocepacia]|nr:hypothetical protein F01_420234 [Burkholderia cenocepacia]